MGGGREGRRYLQGGGLAVKDKDGLDARGEHPNGPVEEALYVGRDLREGGSAERWGGKLSRPNITQCECVCVCVSLSFSLFLSLFLSFPVICDRYPSNAIS